MTLGATFGVSLFGLDGNLIHIEVDISDGLPTYSLLGFPALREEIPSRFVLLLISRVIMRQEFLNSAKFLTVVIELHFARELLLPVLSFQHYFHFLHVMREILE